MVQRYKFSIELKNSPPELSGEPLSDATAKREIAFLKKAGYLERVGSLKTGHWIVVSK